MDIHGGNRPRPPHVMSSGCPELCGGAHALVQSTHLEGRVDQMGRGLPVAAGNGRAPSLQWSHRSSPQSGSYTLVVNT
jgi:hypothetical protein